MGQRCADHRAEHRGGIRRAGLGDAAASAGVAGLGDAQFKPRGEAAKLYAVTSRRAKERQAEVAKRRAADAQTQVAGVHDEFGWQLLAAAADRRVDLEALTELQIAWRQAATEQLLPTLREARGISLDQLSARIKVTRHHIENIEADRFESLPAPVYLRGILLSLSRELRLDGQKVARSYLERVSAGGGAKPR